ncbi:hypothetical protein KEM55_004534 [Ascosphaera atra]|nr:hypothetical protein KEM55_004534 [Ascosphaera atra]
MVDLVIYSKAGHQALEDSDNGSGEAVDLTPHRLARSRRATILTYASRLVDTANRVMQMPFFLLGFRVEDEKITVNLMSGVQFSRGKSHMPGMLRVELQSDHRLQVYGAAVRFDAKFRGLRWLMYRWKILSFVVFSGTFWTTSMIVACGTWVALTSGKPFAGEAETLSDESSSGSVKKEDDGNGSAQKSEASDTRFIKPEFEDEGSYSVSGLAAIPEFPREAKEAEEAEERWLREEKGNGRVLAAEENDKGEDEEETKGFQEDEREASDSDANMPQDTPEESTGGTESKDEYTDDDMVKIEESTLIQPLSPDSDAFGATTSRHDEKGTPGEDGSALQRRRSRPVEESSPGEEKEIAS